MSEFEIPRRMRSIDAAKGFDEAWRNFKNFMLINNFQRHEHEAVLHLINSFYFMGKDIENFNYPPYKVSNDE